MASLLDTFLVKEVTRLEGFIRTGLGATDKVNILEKSLHSDRIFSGGASQKSQDCRHHNCWEQQLPSSLGGGASGECRVSGETPTVDSSVRSVSGAGLQIQR